MEREIQVYQVLDYCKLYIESAYYVLGLPKNMHCKMIHAIMLFV